jgi:predicted metal-dependent hydrolase
MNTRRAAYPASVVVWGKKYKLEVIKRAGRPKGEIEENCVKLYIRPDDGMDKFDGRLEKWQKKILLDVVGTIIKKYEPLMKVKVTKLTVRKMRTRFGVAKRSTKKDGIKCITLALMLVNFRLECVEYVVVHEMIHLIQKQIGHNKEFYQFLEKYIPDYKKIKKELRLGYASL